ncbi:kinesin-like protein KIF6 isoform X2 [Pomacea canaliculata]|uniref:kinesin-like protein KIF6 isoform X2 n=1 Tax=Pomacea canaliculata TaxID=400727 RepID=UPI000D72C0E3|nr:kinesin-like protein KIF6 isoform X2 [Pomacea canaliculata]
MEQFLHMARLEVERHLPLQEELNVTWIVGLFHALFLIFLAKWRAKVTLLEDSDQNIHLKNLTVHQANTEEEALNLLFLGDTNRMIAETPMNQASSRSHCIFTIHIVSRETGSATIRRSKLHLVDLAGSERVSKTGVNGQILTEAKYINLSLHYLEQVIVALSEKNRQHVPYRNSLMTSVLRDSLGGNCMTTMIATCSMEKKNMDESISTCRFAQRVAMIRNDVMVNEELDPKLLIMKLRQENKDLRDQLALATGEQLQDELTEDDIQWCEDAVQRYLEDSDPHSYLSLGPDLRKIQACFKIMKMRILQRPAPVQPQPIPQPESTPDVGPYSKTELKKLKDLLLQRDNEINILVNMLKREKKRAADAQASKEELDLRSVSQSSEANGHISHRTSELLGKGDFEVPDRSNNKKTRQEVHPVLENNDCMKNKILGPMSLGRQEAFDIFMRDYSQNQLIEENKQVLKQRYGQAKALGEKLNAAKQRINHLKGEVDQLRTQVGVSEEDLRKAEQSLREEMESEKMIYKETFVELRTMKTEIEHLQHLLEKAKVKLMKDFELWWAQQTTAINETESKAAIRTAWKTPPLTPPNSSVYSQKSYGETQSLLSDTDSKLSQHLHSGRHSHTMAANFTGQKMERADTHLLNQEKPEGPGGIPLTGDPQVDADIMAFVRARQNILRQAQGKR